MKMISWGGASLCGPYCKIAAHPSNPGRICRTVMLRLIFSVPRQAAVSEPYDEQDEPRCLSFKGKGGRAAIDHANAEAACVRKS